MAKRRNSSAKPASDDHVETDTATTAQVGSAGEAASALEAATAVDPEKQTDAPAAGQEPGAPANASDSADAESQGATETEALSDGQAESGDPADTGTADKADEGSGSDAAGNLQGDVSADAQGTDQSGQENAHPDNEAPRGDTAAEGQADAQGTDDAEKQLEQQNETEEVQIDTNAKAAFWASGAVFRGETPVEDLIDPETLSIWRDADLGAMKEAASFFRRWPDSTPEAVCIHMRRRGLPNLPAPNRRMAAAWAVFAYTLRTLDQVTAAEKAEAEAEARAQEKRRLLVDRDRLAMTPEDDSPFSEYGKAAMRRRESPQGEKPRNDQE